MKILVAGASGFVGSHVVEHLLAEGFEVRGLVHSRAPRWENPKVEIVKGDIRKPETLSEALKNTKGVAHCVGIIREGKGVTFENLVAEGTANLVKEAQKAGTEKFVFISALGTRPNARSRYHRTKWQAEEAVRNSGIPFTILRPSIIFGPEDDFINAFAGKWIPFPSGGKNLLQPVYVEDVARIVGSCFTNELTNGKTFELGGPERYEMRQVIAIAEEVFGRKGFHPPIPIFLLKIMARVFFDSLQKFGLRIPVTTDQLLMLEEPNICSDEALVEAEKTFGIKFTPLRDGLRQYAPKQGGRS
ncbi:MAG TPA: complex I NDUFA9 subunit family protein [Fimbriimonadales bacterium]|nr:complex I NDUFA9 subunit family protein [Fimbriimonadales bacterium]